jgi:hypothetical protein
MNPCSENNLLGADRNLAYPLQWNKGMCAKLAINLSQSIVKFYMNIREDSGKHIALSN